MRKLFIALAAAFASVALAAPAQAFVPVGPNPLPVRLATQDTPGNCTLNGQNVRFHVLETPEGRVTGMRVNAHEEIQTGGGTGGFTLYDQNGDAAHSGNWWSRPVDGDGLWNYAEFSGAAPYSGHMDSALVGVVAVHGGGCTTRIYF